MNAEPRDDLDRAIDETLAAFAAAEPRWVTAGSVREAMGESRSAPTRLPVWLALAAALLLGLLMNRREVLPPQDAPRAAASDPAATAPALRPITSATDEREIRVTDTPPGRRVQKAARALTAGSDAPGYEGLPRLTIAPIDSSPALAAARLDTDLIETTGLAIAPLVVPSLSPDPENR